MKTKNIHIDPNDDSTTIIKRATTCCNGYHQTIAGALLKSNYWKEWYKNCEENQLFDVGECELLDCMSDEHWIAFCEFIKKN